MALPKKWFWQDATNKPEFYFVYCFISHNKTSKLIASFSDLEKAKKRLELERDNVTSEKIINGDYPSCEFGIMYLTEDMKLEEYDKV